MGIIVRESFENFYCGAGFDYKSENLIVVVNSNLPQEEQEQLIKESVSRVVREVIVQFMQDEMKQEPYFHEIDLLMSKMYRELEWDDAILVGKCLGRFIDKGAYLQEGDVQIIKDYYMMCKGKFYDRRADNKSGGKGIGQENGNAG